MVDLVVDDDDDEQYGYDLSPEDEQLLLQLAASLDPPRDQHVLVPRVPARPGGLLPARDPADMFVPGEFPSQSHLLRIEREQGGWQAADAAEIRYPNLSAALRDLDDDQKLRATTGSPASPLPLAAAHATTGKKATPAAASVKQNIVGSSSSNGGIGTGTGTGTSTRDPDTRSPLERFRQYPRKPLTVSDLTSGAWCELQYEYTLTKLPGGRKVRTPAMRQGSKVHRKLEEEVHTTVRIDILTKEDGFGLRLWNLVQGLRTLRDTGLTRELEVWGMVDGNLVNGVIDSVSSEHPNPDFEEQLFHQGSSLGGSQAGIADYFPRSSPAGARDDGGDDGVRYYIGDVKTRGSLAPVSKAALRPAKYQLLLYHRFLSDMAAGKLDYFKVFQRYGLDAHAHFSDTFLAQVAELHDEVLSDDASSTTDSDRTIGQDSSSSSSSASSSSAASRMPDLLRYNTLASLVSLVVDELAYTFPRGAASLGHILSVQYLYRADGRELGSHDFPVSAQLLSTYLDNYMGWWKGERGAAGVDIEEAFKCGSCDFAADCSWRREMDEERVKRARQNVAANKVRSC